jgi:hypothetical protein
VRRPQPGTGSPVDVGPEGSAVPETIAADVRVPVAGVGTVVGAIRSAGWSLDRRTRVA